MSLLKAASENDVPNDFITLLSIVYNINNLNVLVAIKLNYKTLYELSVLKPLQFSEKQWEKDQQKYEDFEEDLKQYEETADLLEEAGISLQDYMDQLLEDFLEIIDLDVTLNVEVDERQIAILEDLLEGLGDAADVAADAIVNYGDQMARVVDEAARYKQGISDILSTFGASDALIERAMNNELTQADFDFLEAAGITDTGLTNLQSYTDGLLDCNSAARSLADDALDRLSSAFDEYTENLDRNSAAVEHLQKVNETYKNIIDIVGKKVLDSSGDLTKTLNKTNWELQRNNTHALKSEMNFIAKSRESLEAEIEALRGKNDAESQRILHQLEQQLKDVTDKYTETYESWLDSWEAELQAAADLYTETLEDIVRNFEDSIAGAMGSMSELQEAFDRKKEIDDVYLDDYQKIYELSKLNRDINNSIDDTDNIKSKQALKKLLGEIEQLQEDGVELSEYDVENARRRYELALAMQQLEEAQDAKSQVRMRRDSEGNYGYVYTADANAVADAEQNYEDKLYAMQKANADYIDSLQSNIIQAQQECSEALANLNAADYASYEEYQAAAQEIRDHYQELIADYFQQLGNAVDNNRELYITDWAEYSAATGYKISADEAYVDSFEETVYAVLTGFETMEDAQLAFAGATDDALNDMAMAWYEWYEQTQISLSDGETSIEDYADTVYDKTEELKGYGQELEESAANMAEAYTTAYDNILDKLKQFLLDYTNSVESIVSLDSKLSTSINQVTAALTGYNDAVGSNSDVDDSSSSSSGSGSSGKGSGSSSKSSGSSGKGTTAKKTTSSSKKKTTSSGGWKGKTYTVRSGDTMYGIGAKLGVNARKLWDHNKGHMKSNNWNLIYPGEKIYYDTGGYTGTWGPEGKLAFLHQKELVLNADDTKNFLAGIDILRQISDAIDLNALMVSNSLTNGLKSEVNTSSNNDGILQQMVSITAEFKDATTANEITAA
ncbi:MAG: LysM peptidoglycan-binding domain-containing protein, partial [Bacilli bacterium]|nr:LysM peptidoglycan-binding domain-containing protein [Bacilli bacterium]